ncbi:MAG: hypothetical protein V4550_01885 [Gemmatimonadota bacterium]
MRLSQWIAAVFLFLGIGCRSPTEPPFAIVQFSIQAPLCGGSVYNWQFSIDGVVVGTEMLHGSQTSQLYHTPPGDRVLTAAIIGTQFSSETRLTLRADQTFVHIVTLYCS